MKALFVVGLVASMVLAGCGGKDGGDGSDGGGTTALKAGKGAISGLLINDVFRPVPDGLVLIQELGLTQTSDASGQFTFADLEPGSYVLRVQADGHEAAPQTVEVKEGEYTEAEVVARRVFNAAGAVLTNEFSVFVPCAAGFIANGVTANCVLDLSGDSYRSSFTSNLTEVQNITYMVTEWKFNQVGDWNGQVREDNGEPAGGERYATVDIVQGDYAKVIMELGALVGPEYDVQRNAVPWNNTKEFATAIFLNGQFKNEAQDGYDQVPLVCDTTSGADHPVLCSATGLGAAFGVKAKIVQSVFLGEPDIDLAAYCVLC